MAIVFPSLPGVHRHMKGKLNGPQVLATNLVPALANNNEWASLGSGTYTPLCLSWVVTANNTYTLYYIKLNLDTNAWSEISSAD